jgi:large subunit ribosomal protein L29
MKASELRDLTDEELQQKEAELKRKLFTLRFQVAMGQQDNTAALRETRRDIARVKTVLRERDRERLREREKVTSG